MLIRAIARTNRHAGMQFWTSLVRPLCSFPAPSQDGSDEPSTDDEKNAPPHAISNAADPSNDENSQASPPGSAAHLLDFLQKRAAFQPTSKKAISSRPRGKKSIKPTQARALRTAQSAELQQEIISYLQEEYANAQRQMYRHADAAGGGKEGNNGTKDTAERDACKIEIARAAIQRISAMTELSLPLSSLARAMYYCTRLAQHCWSLEFTEAASGIPDYGQMEVVSKAMQRVRQYFEETGGGKQQDWRTPTAEFILHSCGMMMSHDSPSLLPPDILEFLARSILDQRESWTARSMVTILFALGRLRALPLEGELHGQLRDAMLPLLGSMGYRCGNVLNGMVHSGFDPGRPFIHAVLSSVVDNGVEGWNTTSLDGLLQSLIVFDYDPMRQIPDGSATIKLLQRHGKTGGIAGATEEASRDDPPSLGFRVPPSALDRTAGEWNQGSPTSAPSANECYAARFRGGQRGYGVQGHEDDGTAGGSLECMLDGPAVSKFLNLRALQALARQWEAERRRGLSELMEENNDSCGKIGGLNNYGDNSGGDLSELAAKAVAVRAKRAAAARLAKETDDVLKSLRRSSRIHDSRRSDGGLELETNLQPSGGGAAAADQTPSLETLVAMLLRGNETSSNELSGAERPLATFDATASSKESPAMQDIGTGYADGDDGFGDVDCDEGTISDDDDSTASILRLGDLLAERIKHPDTGRTVITAHYEASSLLQSSSTQSGDVLATTCTNNAEDDDHDKPSLNSELLASGDSKQRRPGEVAVAAVGMVLSEYLAKARTTRALARLSWYCGTIGYYDEGMFRTITKRLTDMGARFDRELGKKSVHGVKLLQGYALHREQLPEQLVEAAVQACLQSVLRGNLPPEYLAVVIWALAAMGQLDRATFTNVCELFKDSSDQDDKYLSMMFQAAMHLEMTTGHSHEELLPAELLQPAKRAWADRGSDVQPSFTQKQVADTLRSMGVQCEVEYSPPGSMVVIDIAVIAPPQQIARRADGFQRAHGGTDGMLNNPVSFRRVAVEVDGPTHFALNEPKRIMASTHLRNALLKHQGWSVVSIPYWEWEEVSRNEARKRAYLREKVVAHLVS